jgi:hypothetical protein
MLNKEALLGTIFSSGQQKQLPEMMMANIRLNKEALLRTIFSSAQQKQLPKMMMANINPKRKLNCCKFE